MVVHQEFQDLDFQVAYNQITSLDCSQAKGRAFLAVNNPGSYWVHFLDAVGTIWEWVWPTAFGWVMPLPLNRPAQLRVSTADVPTGYSIDSANQTAKASISVLSDVPRLSLGVQQLVSTKAVAGQLDWIFATAAPYNATGDGVTDDTGAIQSALNAAIAGQTVYLPAVKTGKFYSFTTLTIPAGVKLKGAGWFWLRDNVDVFGAAGWSTRTNYGGSVLISSAASGTVIGLQTSATSQSGALEDLLILGPGSGTATGFAQGGASAVVNTEWRNVGFGNFATGGTMTFCEDNNYYDLSIRGCTTPLAMATNCNNNRFYGYDQEKCANPLTLDATCLANKFTSPIFQGNTGQSYKSSGNGNVLDSAWVENPAGTAPAVEIVSGDRNAILNYRGSSANDGIKVDAAATNTAIWNLEPETVPVTNAGASTFFIGNGGALTDTGSNTIYIDQNNNKIQLAITNVIPNNGLLNFLSAFVAAGTGGAPTLPANTPTGGAGGAGKWMKVNQNGATGWILIWQ